MQDTHGNQWNQHHLPDRKREKGCHEKYRPTHRIKTAPTEITKPGYYASDPHGCPTAPNISARGNSMTNTSERHASDLAADPQTIIEQALHAVAEMNTKATDGEWLEDLTVQVAVSVKEWDISECWKWSQWTDREAIFQGLTKQDIGIDCVAVRRSDGQHIAIQCKSRQLSTNGQGTPITKSEVDSFASTSAGEFWAERWIVTNGDNPISGNTQQALAMTNKPIKMVNIANDLLQQRGASTHEECPHCEPNPDEEERMQSKTCMQTEAIANSARILKEHEQSESGGIPIGQARGKIILPCGTGKTRISLRIIEELTPPGELSIVLSPSIALVAQIRREYLQQRTTDIKALAVCSDETAGYDPKKEGVSSAHDNPTLDSSNVSASEVKGPVTTDEAEITAWIEQSKSNHRVNVIFGTYQSSHRIAAALLNTGTTAAVLIADEAHRTAGLRRNKKLEERIRDFTICHDNHRFPAKYRIYQTATPRVYDTSGSSQPKNPDWVVRNMDDETVFGVELYRKSYMEAVSNGWLADYRIIALGVNDPDAYAAANELARTTTQKGKNSLTTAHFLKGMTLALVLGGGTFTPAAGGATVKSCISFMNTVAKSKAMSEQLQSDTVRNWVQRWLDDNRDGQRITNYKLDHLDASSNVTARDNAKNLLAQADEQNPYGIINVGIFGEGTDAPTLSAVAFLEARKSPIDVIQAVGRAMRTAPGKEMGYIICPIMIPPNVDAEQWLKTSSKEDGWQELGQILLALRAHDSRIEDNLAELLQLYIPAAPETESTVVAIANREEGRIQYHGHIGAPGEAQKAVESVLEGRNKPSDVFVPLNMMEQSSDHQRTSDDTDTSDEPATSWQELPATPPTETKQSTLHAPKPSTILAGKKNNDGNIELRVDGVAHFKPAADGTPGPVDIKKTKSKAKDMINKDTGVRLPPSINTKPKPRRTQQEVTEHNAMQMLLLTGLEDRGIVITANLLTKSGLNRDRCVRDQNILETSVREAARNLRDDKLSNALDIHFHLDNLNDDSRKKQADGCTIAALLMMNAAMLHQRIAAGHWLNGVSDLKDVKNDVNVVRRFTREWERIMRHDFHPVLVPAIEVIQAVEDTGKTAGMERALHLIAADAESIAKTYADMGTDHAGHLFNRVMGNQASDGAYFTRPVAASIAARITLDACSDVDWSDPEVWRDHKIVDLACGSGTLLAAMLTEMKRRAREQQVPDSQITELQKIAVEETIKGLEINPVSLQLAASQLTAGNQEIRYRKMGLHLMPYGPEDDNPAQVSVGTLELLGQKAIVPRDNELNLADDNIGSQVIWNQHNETELEDAVDAAKDARIVIMNPPFTNRAKMGEKFPAGTQQALRSRVDSMEQVLVRNDNSLEDFADKNSVRPLFVALADRCLPKKVGIMTMIVPTIALSAPSGLIERRILAERYHIHTVLTCHQPGNFNLVQRSNINESIIVATRHEGEKPPTRFINLDRLPANDSEVEELHHSILRCQQGQMDNGWGEVSYWPANLISAGDWTPAIWRSPELAKAAAMFAAHPDMETMKQLPNVSINKTGAVLYNAFEGAKLDAPGSFPILKSAGSNAQTLIKGTPDQSLIPKKRDESIRLANGGTYPEVEKIQQKAGHLLITFSQDSSSARLSATASDTKYIGDSWMPVTGLSFDESKAIAVFINSTAGRLQLMRNLSRKLTFPQYNPAAVSNIRIPNIKDARIRKILADCWEQTKDVEVPQFRDGDCEVRRLWDEAVAEAMGWDTQELARLRGLLNNEPHVRGLGYNQYADEAMVEPADQEPFPQLEDQQEDETTMVSSSR